MSNTVAPLKVGVSCPHCLLDPPNLLPPVHPLYGCTAGGQGCGRAGSAARRPLLPWVAWCLTVWSGSKLGGEIQRRYKYCLSFLWSPWCGSTRWGPSSGAHGCLPAAPRALRDKKTRPEVPLASGGLPAQWAGTRGGRSTDWSRHVWSRPVHGVGMCGVSVCMG